VSRNPNSNNRRRQTEVLARTVTRSIALMNAAVNCRQTVNLLACLCSFQVLGFAQSTVLVPATDGPRQTCAGPACPGVPGTGQLSSPATPGPATLPSALGPEPSSSRVPTALEPPAPATEFQDFVTTSVGRKLPIYGYSLFDRVPSTFAPIDRVPVTADYVHGWGPWRCPGPGYGRTCVYSRSREDSHSTFGKNGR
jgi:hypothetical protein